MKASANNRQNNINPRRRKLSFGGGFAINNYELQLNPVKDSPLIR